MDLEWDEVFEDIAGGARRNENTAVVVRGQALGDETGGYRLLWFSIFF